MKKLTTLATAVLLTGMSLTAVACTPEQIAASRSVGIVISAAQEQYLLALPNRYAHPDPQVDQWYDTALAAGWPSDMWEWQSCVIERESQGNPGEWYRLDPSGGSRGLMQINGSNTGFLRRAGIIVSANDLFDPLTNLRAGLALYLEAGKRPWVSNDGSCRI